jgi:DNA-binding response OmpR family regulator
MSSATTIVFARADLSIPDATASSESLADHADNVQARFFDLVIDNNPDIIVLDFSAAAPSGSDTILSIRRRCPVPVLVVCQPGDPMTEEYRIAGASECIFAPIDILSLHRSIEGVLRVTGRAMPPENRPNVKLALDGMNPRMQHKSLAAAVGPS